MMLWYKENQVITVYYTYCVALLDRYFPSAYNLAKYNKEKWFSNA